MLHAIVVASLLTLGLATGSSALDPVDIVIYADHPLTTPEGSLVPNPFDGPSGSRARATVVAGGLRHPLGTSAWGNTSWAKYVFLGNYGGFESHAEGQRVGVFDSERRKLCELDIDASSAFSVQMLGVGRPQEPRSRIYFEGYNGTAPSGADFGYIEGDLNSRCACGSDGDCGTGGSCLDGRCMAGSPARVDCQTTPDCAPGRQCLDNPCAPYEQGGWRVVKFTALQLNCVATGLPIGCAPEDLKRRCSCASNTDCGDGGSCVVGRCVAGSALRADCQATADCAPIQECLGDPCPGQDCRFDGMVVLDPDTVVLNNWIYNRFVAVRIGATGDPAVVSVHTLPAWKAPTVTGECYGLEPVGAPAADPTRAPGDQRFMSTFDITCKSNETSPLGCPLVGRCPLDLQQVCEIGQNTCPAHCRDPFPLGGGFVPCSDDPTCTNFLGLGINLGPCTNACYAQHPTRHCTNDPSQLCVGSAQCSSCPPPPTACCACGNAGGPVQEFRFDGVRITPTSTRFQSGPGMGMRLTKYDSMGNAWVTGAGTTYDDPNSQDPNENVVVSGQPMLFNKNVPNKPPGEHSYFDDQNGAGSDYTRIPQRAQVGVPAPDGIYGYMDAIEAGNKTYFFGGHTVRRAVFGYGMWFGDSLFQIRHWFLEPWSERKVCSGSGVVCGTGFPACPGGQTCGVLGARGLRGFSSGGSPPSLWIYPQFNFPDYKANNNTNYSTATYLERIPLLTVLPDGAATGKPDIAWSGDRMWLVAPRDGVLKYRVRRDGLWSSWFTFTSPLDSVGGAAVISNGTTVQVYARKSDGTLWMTSLAPGVSLTCAPEVPGSCAWNAWTPLPAGVLTDREPAATYVNGVYPLVAIRNMTGAQIYFAFYFCWGTCNWVGWYPTGNLTTDLSPAVAHKPPPENKTWFVARKSGTNELHYAKVVGPTVTDPWTVVNAGQTPALGGVAPEVVWDGAHIRLFASESPFPSYVYQVIHDGSWGNWRRLVTEAGTTYQPSATVVNGDVNLVTKWWTSSIAEQGLESTMP